MCTGGRQRSSAIWPISGWMRHGRRRGSHRATSKKRRTPPLASPTSSPDRPARHLFDAWPDVARRLASADRLALFTDFDGTLTAIRRHANSVRLSTAMRTQLAALARRGHLVGVVSGRGLEDVRTRVGVPGLWYVGAHGFVIRTPDRHTVVLANEAQQRLIARIGRRI